MSNRRPRKTTPDILDNLLGSVKKPGEKPQVEKPAGSPQSQPSDVALSWNSKPVRHKQSYMLSDQVSEELDKLYLQIRLGGKDCSKSELVEIALQVLLERVQAEGIEGPLLQRLSGKAKRK
jgi:hypothetical protein